MHTGAQISTQGPTLQVRVGSTLSDLYDQEQGVPQGGVLSTTLFNIKINDIVKCLDDLVQ